MNGVHDLGGMHGFGPVDVNEEPHALERWEAAVIAIMRAGLTRRVYNVDEFRHSIERMDPAHYLSSPYYEHWLDGIARLFAEKGEIDVEVLDARTTYFDEHPDVPTTDVLDADPAPLRPPAPRHTFARPETAEPRFAPGDRVRARVLHPQGHTRLPRYLRGKQGTVERYRGFYVFPDSSAHGLGEDPQALYNVRFDATEVWGEAAERRAAVHIDMWESYLEPA